MKITHNPIAAPRPAADHPRPAATAAAGVGSSAAVDNPSLGRVADQLQASSDIDMDKVSAIRHAIAEGRLPMDLDRLAEAVLDLHRR